MIKVENIKTLVQEKLIEFDGFLVSITVSLGNNIKVFIDNPKGISIEECIQISRHIENNLNREEEDFELSVSSPGLDSPFLVKEQYLKNLGQEVEIKLLDGEKLKGKLLSFEDEIVLKTEKKIKKELISEEILIPINQIKETKRVLKF